MYVTKADNQPHQVVSHSHQDTKFPHQVTTEPEYPYQGIAKVESETVTIGIVKNDSPANLDLAKTPTETTEDIITVNQI